MFEVRLMWRWEWGWRNVAARVRKSVKVIRYEWVGAAVVTRRAIFV